MQGQVLQRQGASMRPCGANCIERWLKWLHDVCHFEQCYQAHKQESCAPASSTVQPQPQPPAAEAVAAADGTAEANEADMHIEATAQSPVPVPATDMAAALQAPMVRAPTAPALLRPRINVRCSASFVLQELLGAEQKLALERSDWLHDILRSERLQQHIQAITSAPDSQAALRAARSNPEFEQFVEQLLGQLER